MVFRTMVYAAVIGFFSTQCVNLEEEKQKCIIFN